jgi:hypothetical protein
VPSPAGSQACWSKANGFGLIPSTGALHSAPAKWRSRNAQIKCRRRDAAHTKGGRAGASDEIGSTPVSSERDDSDHALAIYIGVIGLIVTTVGVAIWLTV